MHELIENLARQKSFEAPSPEERAVVLSEMPREAYERLRAALRAAPALDADVQPPPALRRRLLARMAPPARPRAFLRRSVPLWQAAAAVLAAAALAGFMKKTDPPATGLPVVELRTDTVFLQKIEWKERIVVRERVVFREKPPVPVVAFLPEKTDAAGGAIPEVPIIQFPAAPLGTSLGSEPGLLDFFVQIK